MVKRKSGTRTRLAADVVVAGPSNILSDGSPLQNDGHDAQCSLATSVHGRRLAGMYWSLYFLI
jgi:hypothetical protein